MISIYLSADPSKLPDRGKSICRNTMEQWEIKDCSNYSVVQWLILCSVLYLFYTNEVGVAHKLLEVKLCMSENIREIPTRYTNITHCIVGYLDDSNNIITFKDPSKILHYIYKFFQTFKIFYNANQFTWTAIKQH